TQSQQIIPFLHEETFVSPLKKMAAAAMTPIKKHRIRNSEPMHPTSEVWAMCLRDKMKVVCHQNKTENSDVKTPARLGQQFNEAATITIIPKNPLPCVAPRAEMV